MSAPQPGSTTAMFHRHRKRWIIVLVVLGLLTIGVVPFTLYDSPDPAPDPLTLPATGASGPFDGTWTVDSGSVVGFRVKQTMLGFGSDVAGRTTAVTGTATTTDRELSSAGFQVGLTTVTVSGKTQPKFAESLGTADHPTATFTLTGPMPVDATVTTGKVVTGTATGTLGLRGTTRPVTVTLSGRTVATGLAVTGTIPVEFSAFGIERPRGYGSLGSLADHGIVEFLLMLRAA